jgi:aspartate/methionine/tyrosine aminotransferase
MKSLSKAAEKLEGQRMFQILAKTQELERNGKSIIHFEIGDPNFNTPKYVVDAALEALRKGDTHYTSSKGLYHLLKTAAEVTFRSRNFTPDLSQLLVTPGANYQIRLTLGCAVNPGEEVIIPDPSFVSYRSLINYMGAIPVSVPLYEENEFRLNPEDIKRAISDKTRMIIINSPNNPTGSVMKESELEEVFNIAVEADVYLLSDEVYSRQIYKEAETEFCSLSKYDHCKERTIIVNGFSKSFAMTGWRLGVVTGPSDLIEKMQLLLESELSCVSPFIQRAGIEALIGDQSETFKMIEEYKKRRDLIVDGLNSIQNISCVKPGGAFYAFPNIKKLGVTDGEFADFLLEKAGVAVCPGSFFGEYGKGYIRLCYANSSIEDIDRGIGRMRQALES